MKFQKMLHHVSMLMVTSQYSFNCQGVPNDSTEREVSHIFRPFPGFINARLIPKKTHQGRKYFFCFVDFEKVDQACIAKDTLQGYKFHNKDLSGVRISFATPTNVIKGNYGKHGKVDIWFNLKVDGRTRRGHPRIEIRRIMTGITIMSSVDLAEDRITLITEDSHTNTTTGKETTDTWIIIIIIITAAEI